MVSSSQRAPQRRGRVSVLSVPIDAWQVDDLVASAIEWAAARSARTIMYANVHVLNTAHVQPALQRALRQADTVYCDGSGVRLGACMLGGSLPARMTGADWIEDFCSAAAGAGTRVFLLAGEAGVAARAAEVLIGRHPGLCIVGTHHGYLDEDPATASALAAIEATEPEVVFVGMGTPRQELWVMKHRDRLGPRVVWCVGALFDFVAGVQQRGPRWLVDHHMEWAARLLSDPRRLWKRYVVGNPLFLMRVAWARVTGN
jgi:N-acetylglucosaminyldiphosphoundecaprenol N-acetyl-beta-D-mannosaminyltransferase